MPAPQLPKWQINLLADVFSLGTDIGALADTAAILKVMSAMRPDLPQIAAAEARICLQNGDFAGARALLDAAEARHPKNAVVKAMLAFCLFVQRDGLWQAYAEETMQLPEDDAARGVIAALSLASNRQFEARPQAEGNSTPEFVLPAGGILC